MLKLLTANRIIFILSLLGLLVSLFLAYEYIQTTPVACPITGNGCDIVKNSAYSKFLGISIPYLGIAFYTFMAFLSVVISQKELKLLKTFQFLAIITAFLFSAYLTFLEATVIRAYCFWCLTSATITTIILLIVVLDSKRRDEDRD